jgi:hypothetical protein
MFEDPLRKGSRFCPALFLRNASLLKFQAVQRQFQIENDFAK